MRIYFGQNVSSCFKPQHLLEWIQKGDNRYFY